jgi:hypothetical protein
MIRSTSKSRLIKLASGFKGTDIAKTSLGIPGHIQCIFKATTALDSNEAKTTMSGRIREHNGTSL